MTRKERKMLEQTKGMHGWMIAYGRGEGIIEHAYHFFTRVDDWRQAEQIATYTALMKGDMLPNIEYDYVIWPNPGTQQFNLLKHYQKQGVTIKDIREMFEHVLKSMN